MKTEILEKNMNSLCKRYPDWNIDNYDKDTEEKSIQIEQDETYDGKPITSITIIDKKYYLGGKYNPDKMANIQAHLLKEKKVHLQFILGIGDGRLVREYLLLMDSEDYCLVYEPNIQMFMHMMTYYDFSDLFEDERCIWLVDQISEYDIETLLANVMTLENVLNCDIYISNCYDKIEGKKIEDIIKKIRSSIETMQYNWGTNIFFQECVAENVILNFRSLNTLHPISGLMDILSENMPVIVVAAGPSLDKNIEQLRKVSGRACIIACDTALKPLLEKDIIPDFFVVIDPKKPMELFENEKVWKIPMIADMFIPHQIMHRHKGMKFLFDNSRISQTILKEISEENESGHDISVLLTGGSVANNAFSLAKIMGTKIIILVGQDLANTGGKGHASGTFQKDSVNICGGEIWVESVDGEMVSTSAQFQQYLKWFEREIKRNEDIHVIDATEGGALIHGSEVMTLEQAIEQYCNTDCNIARKLEDIPYHFSNVQQAKLREIYLSMPKELEKLHKMANKGKDNYQKLEKLVDRNALPEELKKVIHKTSSTNKKLEEHFLWPVVKLANANEEFTILVRTSKEEKEGSDTIKEDIALGKRYMEKILANIDHIAPFVDELAEYYSKD